MKFKAIRVENGITVFQLFKTVITFKIIRVENNVNIFQPYKTEDICIRKNPVRKIDYILEVGDCFKIGIEENSDRLIIEKNEDSVYTEEDLEKEYACDTVYDTDRFQITSIPKLLKYKNKGHLKSRYIIGLEFKGKKLMFVPTFVKDDVITSFACLSFDEYDKIKEARFMTSACGYPVGKFPQKENIHERIYGKKAEKGGWYLIKKNDIESNVEALWITMISGRSIDQYDPNPNDRDFYYYSNPENGYNIKVSKPERFVEGFENVPKITEGNPGDFYKDKSGDIYVKIDEHQIDHMDCQPFDARRQKLREIPRSANGANRYKDIEGYIGAIKSDSLKNPFLGIIIYRGKTFSRYFKTQIEAARFYDYHSLALHGIRTTLNHVLSIEVENELLLCGIEKIPIQYRVKEKLKNNTPGIRKFSNGKCTLIRQYKTLKINKTYENYEDACKAWQDFENKVLELKEEEKKKTLELNKENVDDKHGYIIIKEGEKEHRVKLNIEAYKEFVHCNWSMVDGRPRGIYKGKNRELSVHVIKFYIKDYNRREMGTVDHRIQDPLDCTIEALRPASASLQSQNVIRENTSGYTGVFIRGTSFNVRYKTIEIYGFDCLEDAARKYNELVEEDLGRDELGRIKGHINIVPDNKRTTIQDLFSSQHLTLQFLQNANVSQIRTIVMVNPELRSDLPDYAINNTKINKKNYKTIIDLLIEILDLE